MTDPVSDLLARIRNAAQARHPDLLCPASKLKLAVAKVMADSGFLDSVSLESQDGKAMMRVRLRYGADGRPLIEGMRRVSKPSRRAYVDVKRLPRVRQGLGIAVISTPNGVLSDKDAREQRVGGEVVCEVW
jgi:small subunit ribosomal protein S8